MYSHPGEYRKIFLANYLCIGFVPGGNSGKKRAHKLKKNPRDTGRVSLAHPAGQTGVYWPVSQRFPVI